VGILVISAFGAVAVNSDVRTLNDKSQGDRDFTHTVFAEDATATWCGYCHFAHEALKNIYTSGDYPFFYTTLVDDKNTHAHSRIIDYNVVGFPSVFFDGGNIVQVGGYTGNEADYRASIVSTGARTVKNIDVSLDVTWLGDAAMTIEASVKNNEATQYSGHIRVYITEIGSTMGWKDTTGHVYTFPFLDYAVNQDISITSGNTWTQTTTWDGHDYNDGHGNSFGNILYGNIEVLAVVFNSQAHQGYADPPSGNPFTAYWVDDMAGVRVGANTPPNTPNTPNPANGSTNVDIHKQLSFVGGDVNPFDTVAYDVYFGTTSPPPKVVSNQSSTTYNPGTLNLLTTYYWKIVAWDNVGDSAAGPIWQFTTRANHPPNTPSSPRPTNGATDVPINSLLSWTGGDPDSGDTVTYNVYFGTTNPPPKVANNQSVLTYNPGTMGYTTTYYWKIVAFDSSGLSAEGPLWQFTTGNEINNPPTKPTITGPPQGKPGKPYTYVFIATDPEQDDVYYFINWGDNTTAQWSGPYTSGTQVMVNHTWSTKGTYTVQAKAKDVHDAESDWGTLQVKMPISFSMPHPHFFIEFLQRILERFPLLERLFIH
jgi:glutaredoxin